MIETIIFSYNNPQMLSLTLESVQQNMPKSFKIHVLYNCDEKHQEGYDILIEKYKLNWEFVNIKLKENLIKKLKEDIKSKEILFLTDGDTLFKKFNYEIIQENLKQDDVLCHSLRLGLNTTHCDRMKVDNVIKAEEHEKYIKWNWTKHYMDFGYPFSLHGHVFNTKEITKLIRKVNFENYFDLEENLQMFEYYPKEYMTSFKDSRSVFIPYNPEYITLDEFLNGYVPDLNGMDFSKVNKCEGEIHFENQKQAR